MGVEPEGDAGPPPGTDDFGLTTYTPEAGDHDPCQERTEHHEMKYREAREEQCGNNDGCDRGDWNDSILQRRAEHVDKSR